MKKTLLTAYLVMGVVVCSWFTVAAAMGWKAPDFGVAKALSEGSRGGSYGGGTYGGRSIGGSWGGGK
ncbi:hypothetical protein NHH03_13745 [Stieleria sp. TO1_6]|uniref:hypothetical protein n=1 Tax=Stieleria tagensis TaxID=2956795 RepID=UPI00209ADA31|nr:hypothetical protein [Stieleria tagensis]MCO8122806.1 hypothetical protein [Stieleria tagensis]